MLDDVDATRSPPEHQPLHWQRAAPCESACFSHALASPMGSGNVGAGRLRPSRLATRAFPRGRQSQFVTGAWSRPGQPHPPLVVKPSDMASPCRNTRPLSSKMSRAAAVALHEGFKKHRPASAMDERVAASAAAVAILSGRRRRSRLRRARSHDMPHQGDVGCLAHGQHFTPPGRHHPPSPRPSWREEAPCPFPRSRLCGHQSWPLPSRRE